MFTSQLTQLPGLPTNIPNAAPSQSRFPRGTPRLGDYRREFDHRPTTHAPQSRYHNHPRSQLAFNTSSWLKSPESNYKAHIPGQTSKANMSVPSNNHEEFSRYSYRDFETTRHVLQPQQPQSTGRSTRDSIVKVPSRTQLSRTLDSEMAQTLLLTKGQPNAPWSFSLSAFYNRVHRPLTQALVQQISCHTQGTHDYVLVRCSLTLPISKQPITVFLRLERKPISVESRTVETFIQLSMDPTRLHQDNSLAIKGYFNFNQPGDNPRKMLRLARVLDMYEYLAWCSMRYTIPGSNPHWLCVCLMECLRECEPCYSGQWVDTTNEGALSEQGTLTTARVKNLYLAEKHPDCCRFRVGSTASDALAEGTTISSCMATVGHPGERANRAQNLWVLDATEPRVAYTPINPPQLPQLLRANVPTNAPDLVRSQALPDRMTLPSGQPDMLRSASTSQASLTSTISDYSRVSSMPQHSIWLNSISLFSLCPPSTGSLRDADDILSALFDP
ncbi:hypothetical protein FRC08_005071 [Ceratobasidium sp. 394]|nr:hypothetical protein FRC08_005071 [Ceratobasidium sp. 394]